MIKRQQEGKDLEKKALKNLSYNKFDPKKDELSDEFLEDEFVKKKDQIAAAHNDNLDGTTARQVGLSEKTGVNDTSSYTNRNDKDKDSSKKLEVKKDTGKKGVSRELDDKKKK